MKRILLFTILMLVTAIGSIFIFTAFIDTDSSDSERVIHTTLFSSILNEEREVYIHLPRLYDSTLQYPVMYVLDGGSQDAHLAKKFDVLTNAGYAPATILVGIPNMTATNRQLNLTPPFMKMDNEDEDSAMGDADIFLEFMEDELIPFIDSTYSTSSDRLLSGNSRGGLLTMYSFIRKPDLFSARFCYSTPLWRQNNILVSKVAAFLHTKDTLNTFLYMSVGANETANIKGGLNSMVKVLNEKVPAGFVWFSDVTPNAIHQNNATISASLGIRRWSEYVMK